MKTKLEPFYKDKIRDAEVVAVDLDDTLINGNACYGAFYIVWDRLKKGKIVNAIKLGAHGIRLYAESHLRRDSTEWDRENYFLKELYRVLGNYDVTSEEMKKYSGIYIKSMQNRGAKNFLGRIRNFGEKKKMILITRESEECADAAKEYFNFDEAISNKTKSKEGGKIDRVEIIIKGPQDGLKLLRKSLKKENVNPGKAMHISDNPPDSLVYKDNIGIFATYKRKNGNMIIDDFQKFEKALISAD
ncbi:MAG: hypothetical protein ABIE55_01770 [Candidatus Aenigmatarchaeota archaeon]